MDIIGLDKDKKIHLIQVLDKEVLSPIFGILREETKDLKSNYLEFGTFGSNIIKIDEGSPNSLYGEKTTKIYTNFPYEVGRIKNDFTQTFQADIKWEKMAMSKIIKICGLVGPFMEVPEDYVYRFLKLKDIKKIEKDDFFYVEDRVCYWDIETDSRNLAGKIKFEDYEIMPMLSVANYDNYEDDWHIFLWHPDFIKKEERVYYDYKIPDKSVKVLLRKLTVHEFTSEKEVMEEFFLYFGNRNFNKMFGYFSAGGMKQPSFGGKTRRVWVDGFDIQCFYSRAKVLGLLEEMQVMSPCPVVKKHWGGYEGVYLRSGENKHQVIIKGVGQTDFVFSEDVLKFAQKFYDFRGHRLQDWMKHFLDYEKLDKEKYRVWQYWMQEDCDDEDFDDAEIINGVPRIKNKGLDFMINYNLVDVIGCIGLDEKFEVSKKQTSRTEVSISPYEDALYASKLHDHFKLTHYQDKYFFDTKYQPFKRKDINGKDQIGNKFTITLQELEKQAKLRGKKVEYKTLKDVHKVGGYVYKPIKRGVYDWMAVLDFTKFYPNAIKSANIGIVSAVDLIEDKGDYVFGWIIDEKEGRIKKLIKRSELIETPLGFFRKDVKSINSLLFDRWLEEREEAQKKLKDYVKIYKTTKSEKYTLLWTEQFNLKNFTNAGFGVMGLPIDRTYSEFSFKNTTITCQDIIFLCINKLIERKIIILTGDSVTKDTPILLLDGRKDINIKTIDDIGKNFIKVGNKEIGIPKFKYKVWTDNGYTEIKKIIRHKTKKRIYRILTNIGCIDVTEDHSLLNKDGIEIKPSDLKVGDELLHSFPFIREKTKEIDLGEESKMFGLFYADGSCGYYRCPSGNKYSWAINNKDYKLLEETKNILNRIYSRKNISFKILDTLKSSNVYKLVPVGSIKYMVNKYRRLFYDKNRHKKVPKIVLNSNQVSRKNFFEWYYKGDGCKTSGGIRLDNKGKIGTMGLFYLMKSIGYNVSINTRESKPNIFRLAGNKTHYGKSPFKIKKIIDLDFSDDYVYDLETENHHFHAGIGEIIVHNTDSVFIQLKSKNLDDALIECNKICDWLNESIDIYLKYAYNIQKHTIKIGLETISDKFYVDSKKHYIKRNVYSDDTILDKAELEIKGMDLKKRSNSELGADNQIKIIDAIFESSNPMDKILDYIKEVDKNLKTMKWGYICKRGALNKDLDKYPVSNESATSARNTLKYMDKYYGPGSNPFIGVFKETPREMNGKFIDNNGQFKMSFEEEDEEILRELGFVLDYRHVVETQCIKKTEHLLSIFNETWDGILESASLGDFGLI